MAERSMAIANEEKHIIEKYINDGDVVFDIGAHEDTWSEELLRKFPNIKLYAFEPAKENYGKLLAHRSGSYEVQLCDLDSYCRQHNIRHIHYLKIDTEGAEFEVIRGAKELLSEGHIDYLQFEYGSTFQDSGTTLQEVYDFLRSIRYELFKMNKDGLRHIDEFHSTYEDYQYCNFFVVNERFKTTLLGQSPSMLDLEKLFAKNNITPKGVIHIGAHEGKEADRYKAMGIKKVLFIEANPEVYKVLVENTKNFDNVICANCAIADSNGQIKLRITSMDQSSSILPLKKHLEFYPSVKEVDQIVVPCRTLDTLLEEAKINPSEFNVINIDIQGAELLAFRGAARTLPHIEAINTEVNYEELYQGCALVNDIDQLLGQYGFDRKATTCPWHRSWGDAFYAKNKSVQSSDPVITMTSLGKNGRFANQLFQYAFLKLYAERHHLQIETPSWIGQSLFGFNDPQIRKILPELKEETNDIHSAIIPNSKKIYKNVDFWGYFQYHTSFYSPFKKQFRQLFKPIPEIEENMKGLEKKLRMKGNTIVGLHLRRGDYGYEYFFVSPTKWYNDWLEKIWPELDNPVLYIASDEPEKVVQDFAKFNPVTAADLDADLPISPCYPDFYLLTKCDYAAISNSSFSFLACMLNENGKKFYRPRLSSGQLIPFDPWNSEVLFRDEKVETTGQILSEQIDTNDRKRTAESLFKKGYEYLKLEDFKQALEYFEQAKENCSEITDLHFALAAAYAQLGDVVRAQNACQIELTQHPENYCAQKLLQRINHAIENHNTNLENMCNNSAPYSLSKNTKYNQNDEPKFSFIMIVLNGMPFIEYSLRSIYDFAHEIIIVEGAVENCMFAANPDGSSNDGTVEFINAFPDPQNKIKLIQGKWPEKCEMQNEALKYVSGNYVWLIDSDEVYKSEDLGKIKQILENDSSITQVNFIPDNFWKGFDYIFVSQKFLQTECHFRRLFKYTQGATFTTHRPPTMVLPGNTATTEQMNLFDGFKTRNMGIILYHYSYVWEKQVEQKIQLYNRYGWGKQWNLDLNKWYNECYLKWTPWNREQIDAKYPIWTGDINSHTEPFNGTHPRVMIDYILKTETAQNNYAMKHVVEAIHEIKNSFSEQQVNAIETGTIRSFYEQHFSTYHISNALGERGRLISVDINPDSIRISKQICRDSKNIEFVKSDSIKYLKELRDHKFHFVFLDTVNDKDFIFEEFRLIIPMMLEGSILMIDNAGIKKEGLGLDVSVAAQKGHRIWQFLKFCDIEYSELYTNQGHGTQTKIVMTKENLDNIKKNIDNFYSGIRKTESQPHITSFENNLTDNQPQPENILWVRTDSIGDAVLAASMLPYIRKKYKDASITVLCQQHIKELYHCCPYIDDVIGFDRNRSIHDEQYRETITNTVRELKPDLSLNSVFSREPINDWFAITCTAPQRIAMHGNLSNIQDQQRQQHNQYYTKLIQSEGENKIELEHHRDFLKGLGINAHSLQPAVWIKPEDEQFAENIFNQYNLNPDKTIALFAAAQFDHRVYQHYGKALSEFCRKNNFKVIALGAQQDYEINRKNLDAIGVESFNLSGKTTILQSAAIIKLCKMAVGAETSLAHIACAVGTPNVILLGGGHFGRFIPYSPLTSIACLPLECYGCNWGCRYRTPHCVKDLAPQVLSEALKQTFEIPSQKSRIFIQGNSLWQRDPEKPQWKSCEDLININNVEIITVGSDTPHPERNIDNTEVRQAAYNLFRQKPLIAKSITPKNEFGKKIPAEKKMSIEIPNILLKSKIDLPYISIVTPSYNQSKYLEECIDSILSQKYPNLEYIIMDGGSTDGSIEIIKKYEKHLAYWQSKPDGGQYKAIEEGFRRSTGEIMAWINSDDKHHPDSLFKAAYIFNKHADIEWITARPTAWNSQGQLISVGPVPVWDGKEHNRTGRKEHYIQQEATFWKRTLWNKAGAKLNTQLQFAGDFELWVRFFKHAQLYSVDTLLGGFRHHTNQKTKVSMEKYYQEAEQTVQAEQADNQSACLRTAPEPLPFENKDFFIFKALALNSQVTENKPGSLLPDNASGYKYDVSIVLSTKDRAQLLDQMLNSLEDAVAGLNYELIVIEGDSSDNTSEILGKHGVTKIYNELEHLGSGKHSWSQLYNFGFSKARGKWAMYASDDIIFSKNCITNAVVRLNRQNDHIAGGIFFYKNSMSRLDWDKYGIDFTHGSKLLLNYGLVRLEHFRKVGGLDEIYKFYCADTDLCYKLYQERLQLIPLSDCFVFHNNVMDVQKKVNMQGSDNDVEICRDRWKHFVPREVPKPRRLLWQQEIVDALSITDDQIEINQGLEFFWHGIACLQKGYVEEAEIKFSQTLNSKINHWVILWYLAQGAYQCGDNDLAIKVLEGLIKIKSDHNIAKEMLNKLISGENQNSRLSGSTTIDKLNFPVTELSSKTNTDSRFERNVNCLIFSKDRAMQLQAAIESFRLHCKDSENVSITVLYKASSDKHKRQYQTLKKRFSDIEFTEETDFKKQTISLTQGSEYIMFMVDDNIFTCDFYIRDAVGALEAETDAAGFSLRLGKNTNYCYPRNANQALPDFSPIENGILKYDWTSAEYDFGYPLELSSSIYRARDIMPMIELIAFNNPNILEEAMAANSKLFARSKPQLLCFENSVTFCNPVNIVQTVYTNRAGKNPEHSAENLTEKFEQGYKIDIQRYSGLAVNACHQETELLLIQDTDRTITASKKRDQNIQPGFSIVMTVYNKENFISDAIESVLKQTFADWELIIVDDCSTDRSGEIICGYLSDNRIKFICNNINRGISASARIGIANVTSEYFGILDADDRLEPCALEIMHRQHVENPHCGLIYSQFTACDEKLNPIRNGFCAKIPKGNTAMEMDTVSHFKTFKACDYLKTTGLDENLAVAEDKDIIYKMEEVTHLKFIDEPLYLYREMRNPDIHADGNVNAGIMCRAKAKINAIKRRSDATAELMQIDPFVEFKKTLRAARQRHPEVDQYLELLQKLYQNNMLGNLSLPQNIESYSIEEKTQWLAANRYIDFKKAIDTLKNPKRENPQPLVTVDMVTYNGEKYIEKAIISVLSQTYRNFELLIIDDGSTDNTGKIIESYSDKRIRYIRQEHKNYAAGKNRAIKEANGEFILCVDSDDLIEPAYIEKMVAAALKHPEADYYYPETLYPLDEHGNLLGVKWKYNDYQDNRKLPALLFAHGFALIPNPGSLRRKSLYENVGLYDEVETVEDFVFLCKNASKINFKRVDEHCWYFYRRVPTGNSHRLKPRNKIMADALNEMVSIYGKEGLCPDIADIADPKLREKEYLKYIVDTFEKHSRNEMVHYKEYFLHYADLYRKKMDYTSTATTTEQNTDTVPEHTEDQHGEYLVTAIVSTYNSEQFIRGCLENLEEQTIADRLQIIVVNSGSEQNEEQIVCEFQERFNNIVYIKTHDREGIYKAWNRAVRAAKGKFITNANTDDRHRHDSLEIMAETLLNNPDAALVYADQICTDTPNPTFKNHHPTQMARKPEYSRSRLLAGCCVGSQPMWRRSLHDEFGWFDESLSCAGDWDFWLRISNKYRLIHIPDFLGIYYHNEHGIEHGRKIHSLYERYLTGKRYGTAYISVIPVYQCSGNPLVSVIIPAYNAGEYVADAIESVLIQNYRNFEVIIIDDGSTDNTKEIIDRFDDEKIQYFYQQNKGAPAACNYGINKAKGDYIIRLDADDMMTPDFIAKHLAEFEIHRDVDLVYTYDLAVSREYKPLIIINRKEYKDRKSLIRDMFRAGFPVIPFRNCIRKSVFEKIGLFDETLIVSEDYDMMKRFVKTGLKAHLLKEAIYIRRMTSDSLSRSSSAKKAKCLIKIIKSFTETFSPDELFPDVDWSMIPAQTRNLHAKCLTAVTCMSIGQDFVESKVPIYAEKAFEQAGDELNECLKIDPMNDRIRELARQCEYAKQKCEDKKTELISL